MSETLQKIIEVFKKNNNQPLRPGEIAEAAGIEKNDVDKSIKIMKKDGQIISPKRCFYSLPE